MKMNTDTEMVLDMDLDTVMNTDIDCVRVHVPMSMFTCEFCHGYFKKQLKVIFQ
jgi:hypothetical protein